MEVNVNVDNEDEYSVNVNVDKVYEVQVNASEKNQNLQQVTELGNVTNLPLQHAPAEQLNQSATLAQVFEANKTSTTNLVPFTPNLKFDKSYKSKKEQDQPINFTLDITDLDRDIHFFNKYQIEITADSVSGIPTFDLEEYEIQYNSWDNTVGSKNILLFQLSSSGKIPVWIKSIT